MITFAVANESFVTLAVVAVFDLIEKEARMLLSFDYYLELAVGQEKNLPFISPY